MDRQTFKWRAAASVERILESCYPRLLKWGELLARGDRGIAQEIVHELYLQLTLSRPDLGDKSNLDGYLYTCLRHIYLSKLARSSREAGRFISIEDCDSVQLLLNNDSLHDSLEIQNTLRRICSYATWRKESCKNFSYFILHFFHGYFHREVADLACVPMAAIYNKLKMARTELKTHLEDPHVLRIAKRGLPPAPVLHKTPVAMPEMFDELRQHILHACAGECLREQELLSLYKAAQPAPLPCEILAHIVSCERCLGIIDNHFRRPTLKDRDSLDGLDRSSGLDRTDAATFSMKLEQIAWRKRRIYEYRPRRLSIAVNGKILALHDVQGEYSLLSARIEQPENTQFVEVFCDQDIRLALLPIENYPPEGPHILQQRIGLSDDRWLELTLIFDGMGLNSEVVYCDPSLGMDTFYVEPDEVVPLSNEWPKDDAVSRHTGIAEKPSVFRWLLQILNGSSQWKWAFVILCIACTTGYLLYRHIGGPLDANAILTRSVKIETASLQGQTEHQILRIEMTSTNDLPLAEGTVDLWKDGSTGRYMRRLYDDRHQLIAAEWEEKTGKRGSYREQTNHGSSSGVDQLLANDLWTQGISSREFQGLIDKPMRITATNEGYELRGKVDRERHPQILSATLLLNRQFHPVVEVVRVQGDSDLHEVRFVQTEYTRTPSSYVPDSVFRPDSLGSMEKRSARTPRQSSLFLQFNREPLSKLHAAELEIEVLYQLHNLGADTSDPIQIARSSDGRIRIIGTVADPVQRATILQALKSLPDHRELDLHIISQQTSTSTSLERLPMTHIYNVVPTPPAAEFMVRKYFEGTGLKGDQLDAAVIRFHHDAQGYGQRALQHAFALDRLGHAFSSEELHSMDIISQQHWAEMVSSHASALEAELRALREQLERIEPTKVPVSKPQNDYLEITDPGMFSRVSRQLLEQTQALNKSVDDAFASGVPSSRRNVNIIDLILQRSIPLDKSVQIAKFAAKLTAQETESPSRSHINREVSRTHE